MSIGSITTTSTAGVAQAATLAQSVVSAVSGADESGSASADSATVSGPAKMLSELKALEQKDPAQFQSVMTAIAGKLTDAAKSSSDPGEQKTLTDLAAKFTAAGQSGDLSALASPSGDSSSSGPSSGGGTPPPGGAPPAGGGGGASSSSKVHDPADTNYDGKVSAKEAAAYREKLAAERHAASSQASASAVQAYAGASRSNAPANGTLSTVQAIVEQALASAGG